MEDICSHRNKAACIVSGIKLKLLSLVPAMYNVSLVLHVLGRSVSVPVQMLLPFAFTSFSLCFVCWSVIQPSRPIELPITLTPLGRLCPSITVLTSPYYGWLAGSFFRAGHELSCLCRAQNKAWQSCYPNLIAGLLLIDLTVGLLLQERGGTLVRSGKGIVGDRWVRH